MISEVESYQRLQREYDEARDRYTEQETRYNDALRADPEAPGLKEQYAELQETQRKLAEMYEHLRGLRASLADERDRALSRASAL